MRKLFSLIVSSILLVTLVACGGENAGDTALITSMAAENSQRTFTYTQANPLVMPDGKVIASGELKPLWQYIEGELGIDITDIANPSQKSSDMFDMAAATQFKEAHIYGGNNLGEKIMNAGTEGYFIDLSKHMDKLPAFKAYLAKNPLVASSITAFDGGIYHIPYIAEVGSYARMYIGRHSWVTAVLDGEVNGEKFPLEAETAELTVSYEPYWKEGSGDLPYGGARHDQTENVIELQRQAAVNGKLSAQVARTVLINYINKTYPNLAKPSDLFLGENAQYDIDELTALWRVLKLHPRTLSKEASGVAKSDATIWPYFVRQSNYREELLRLQNYFGGQRVHGSDSYGSRFYIDENGELQYSYYNDKFLNNLERIKAWASEGLVDERVFGPANNTNLRSGLIFSDKVETNKVYGFMTFDWASSTTALTGGQDDVKAILPPLTTTPASNGEYVHWVENSRVVKPDGWGISTSAKGKTLDAALKLFDYFFTEEGHRVQNYGVPQLWESIDGFTNPFDGVKGPLFNTWARETATRVSSGDISTFLRDHIGALIPIGYQKEIGFEIQSTSDNGIESWRVYGKGNGGKGVLMNTYTATNPFYQLAPAIISLNKNEQNIVKTQTSMTSETQLTDKMFAFLGSNMEEGIPRTVAEVKALFTKSNVDVYISTYRIAYNRIK